MREYCVSVVVVVWEEESSKEKKGESESERESALGPGDYLKNIASTRPGGNRRTMRLSGKCKVFFSFLTLFFFFFFFFFFFSFSFLFFSNFFPCKQNGVLFYVRQSPEGCTRVAIETGRETGRAARGRAIVTRGMRREHKREETYR